MSARKNMSLRHPLTNKSLCNLKVKRKQGLEAKKKKKSHKGFGTSYTVGARPGPAQKYLWTSLPKV